MTNEELLSAFQAAIKVPLQVFTADVIEVDEDSYTIDVKPPGMAEVSEVRLKAAIDNEVTGMVEIPEAGSSVLVGIIGNDPDTAYLIKCSKVAKIIINGGSNGGLTITPKLKEGLEKLSARVDALYDAIENGVPVPTDGGAGYQTTMLAILSGVTETEDFSEIEDELVTH